LGRTHISERIDAQKKWEPYIEGYWHDLVAAAAERLRAEIGQMPHVRDINHGTYHGGTLIIGVASDLSYPGKLDLPSHYLGIPLLQFCAGSIENDGHKAAARDRQ
jgi:hypothetical protein